MKENKIATLLVVMSIVGGIITGGQVVQKVCGDKLSHLKNSLQLKNNNEEDKFVEDNNFFIDTSDFDTQENFDGQYYSDGRKQIINEEINNKVVEEYYNFDITGVEKYTYGTSGNGRELYYYKIGSGNKILFLNFGLHGYEDAWNKDGEELTKLARNLIERLSKDNMTNGLNDWQAIVVPSSNPDGVLDGWTNNGPGRTQVSQKIDLNRSFTTYFTPQYSERYYTGSIPLVAPEAKALATLVDQYSVSSNHMALVDIHGWLNQTIGDPSLSKAFDVNFNISNQLISKSINGYLISYAHSKGALVTLLELPMPNSLDSIKNNQYADKLYNSVKSIIINGDGFEKMNVDGEINADSLNIRITTSMNSDIIGNYDKGVKIKILGKVGDWYQVNLKTDYGYIHKNYVNILSDENNNKNIEIHSSYKKFNIKNLWSKFQQII